jgi:hypothetical protein
MEIHEKSSSDRQDVAVALFHEMVQPHGRFAVSRFRSLAEHCLYATASVHYEQQEERQKKDGQLPQGYLRALNSLRILEHPRVQGYLRGIQAARPPRRAIDIGTGSSALLALGIAAFHPEVEKVIAYECNPHAAACADKVVDMFGFRNKIEIIHADAFKVPLEETDLAISETFHVALGYESGAKLLHRYSEAAKTIMPTYAGIFAGIVGRNDPDSMSHMKMVDLLDFRRGREHVQGTVRYTPNQHETHDLRVMSLLYTEEGLELVRPGADDISAIRSLAELQPHEAIAGQEQRISFTYRHSEGDPAKTLSLSSSVKY